MANFTLNYTGTQINEKLAEIDNINDELLAKVDKVNGKGLSTNDYTTAEKNKLGGIEIGANKTAVDSVLSASSTNPVQNKVVKAALDSFDPLPSGGAVGQVLTKTSNGSTWQNIQHQDISGKENTSNKKTEISSTHQTTEDTFYPTSGAVRRFVSANTEAQDEYNAETFAQKSTTLVGYGITDAYTKAEVDAAIQTAIGNIETLLSQV